MQPTQEELSEIQTAFRGSTIFLTGGTGLVGKLLLEKCLRSLNVKRIYLLIRDKKGHSVEERFDKLFEAPIYDKIKRAKVDYKQIIKIIIGDLKKPDLGLNAADKNAILNEVNYIIHCAATVKFDEPLDVATKINVRATRDMLEIGKQARNLKGFVYVSTAYSNSNRLDIDETFYEPPMDARKLINAIEALEGKSVQGFTKDVIGNFPNTYVFTKNVAESLVRSEGGNLPICIARPSIIMGTAAEPIQGYMDNFYGLSGMLVAMGLGVVRVMYYLDIVVDFIPADYVVNNIIVCAWYAGAKKNIAEAGKISPEITADNNVPIFNIISSEDNPVTPVHFKYSMENSDCYSVKAIWYPWTISTGCYYNFKILEFFLHTLVAYFADFVLWISGKKKWVVKTYNHFNSSVDATRYFFCTQFKFTNKNNRGLLALMSDEDKKIFNMDLKTLDWMDYGVNYLKALRVYLLKDPMETVPEGIKLMKKYRFYNHSAIGLIILLILYTLYKCLF